MHYVHFSHKIENEICLPPSPRQCYFCNVTFVYHKFNKKKKKLESGFSAVHPDIIFAKRQSGNHVMFSTIISGQCGVEIDANLEST